jgi:hypothetical protein
LSFALKKIPIKINKFASDRPLCDCVDDFFKDTPARHPKNAQELKSE